MRNSLVILLVVAVTVYGTVDGAALKSGLLDEASVSGLVVHKIFPPFWMITTKKPPLGLFTIPSWPWPKPGPWPGPWCLSCPKPWKLDRLRDKINPVVMNGGINKIRQAVGPAGP